MDNRDDVLDIEQVADLLGHKAWFVGQLVKRRQIRHMRVGRRLLFRRSDVDAYLDAQAVDAEHVG